MPRLQISAQPASLSLTEGESGELSVTASGYGTLSYQWFKNGSAITNATASSIRFDNISSNDAGSYYVVVYDDNSSTMSSAANITVTTKPTQPVTKPTETATTEAATTQPATKPAETAATEPVTTQPATKAALKMLQRKRLRLSLLQNRLNLLQRKRLRLNLIQQRLSSLQLLPKQQQPTKTAAASTDTATQTTHKEPLPVIQHLSLFTDFFFLPLFLAV